MANFFQRLGAAYEAATKAYRSPSVLSSEKSFYAPFGSSYLDLTGNRDMRRDEWGAAAAYSVNSAVMAAIQVWQSWLDGLVWQIKDGKTDKVLVSSDMRYVNPYQQGAKFYHAVKYHDKLLHHGYFKSIAYSDNLYSETYIRFVRNERMSVAGLQWLNPLYTEPQILRGKIDRYYYSGNDESFVLFPDEVAYRIGLRDPNDDLRGQSRVLAAIDAANLEQNTKKALRGLFSNGMILGGLISPKGEGTMLSPNQIAKLEDDLRRSNKGVNNAYSWAIAPSDINFTQFTPPDVDKSYSIIQPLRNEILMAMGVPPQLANDPSQVSYDNADDLKRQWWQAWAIPYAKDVIEYHNAEILPMLEPNTDIYFDFDFSPYETEKPEVVSQDLNTGVIDIYDAMRLRGVEPDSDLKGIRIINGVPMSKEIILKLANSIPAQYAADYAQADKLDAEAQATESQGETAPSNDSGEVPLNEGATSADGFEYRNGVAIPQKEVFGYHIDAGIVDINEARAQLGLPPKAKEESNELQDLQAKLSIMNSAVSAGISTLAAAEMVGLILPEEAASVSPTQEQVFRSWLGKVSNANKAEFRQYTYNGVSFSATAPRPSSRDDKKYMRDVRYKGEERVVHWGQPNEQMERDNDEARENFNARHNCSEKKDPFSAGFQACWHWQPNAGKSLDSDCLDSDCLDCGHDHYHDLPSIKAFEPQHDSPLDELKAWHKFSKSSKSRSFEPVWLVGDVGDSIQSAMASNDSQAIKAAFDSAFEYLSNTAKAIQATRLDFENDFDELLSRARRERMGRVQWASAMRSIIRRYGTRAYIDGLRDGGVEDEPSEDDMLAINGLISTNSQYVTELGNVLYKEDGISDAQADIKAAMWFNKTVSPFYDEGLLAADANGLYEWAYGNTEEHCNDCARLNGQRHRLKQWKVRYMPQGDNLECGGFQCDCKLVKARGKARGSF